MANFLSPSDRQAHLNHHCVSKVKDIGTGESEQSCSLQSKVGTYWQLSGEVMSTAAAWVVHVLRANRLVQI